MHTFHVIITAHGDDDHFTTHDCPDANTAIDRAIAHHDCADDYLIIALVRGGSNDINSVTFSKLSTGETTEHD
jgi:hypothetical protein